MSKLEVDAIEPQSGTTITIGASGDTVNLVGTLKSNGSPLPGDISSVVAGTGLSGGGTTGAVTINIEAAQPTITSLGTITSFRSTGIDDNADALAITINSSEQVGIGTASPGYPLQINSSAQSTLLHLNSTGATSSAITFANTGSNDSISISAESDNLRLRTDDGSILFHVAENQEKMRLNSTGLGIGTTSPAAPLTVSSSTTNAPLKLITTGSQTYSGIIFDSTQSDDYVGIGVNVEDLKLRTDDGNITFHVAENSEKMRLSSAGNLGIGTSSPSAKLELAATNSGGTANALMFTDTDTGTTANQKFGAIQFNSSDSGNTGIGGAIDAISEDFDANTAIRILTGAPGSASERMRITSAGKVGIGTTSPAATLEVMGTTGANFKYDAASTYLSILPEDANGDVSLRFRANSGSAPDLLFKNDGGSEVVRIGNNGKVGIGTSSPDAVLQVGALGQSGSARGAVAIKTVANYTTFGQAGIYIEEASGSEGFYMGVDVSGGMFFNNSGAAGSTMYLSDDDNVGIGTSAPNTKLMVELGTNGSGLTDALRLRHAGTSANDGCRIQFTAGSSTSGAGIGALGTALNKSDLTFYAGGNTERMRINSSGDLLIGKTTNAFNELGTTIRAGDEPVYITRDNNYVILVNRKSSDGDLVRFYRSTSQKGSISLSGETVSYNSFTGSHWSRFTDNSKPTILRGTVLETLDEMCDWYNLEYNITTTTKDEDGNDVTNTETFGVPHVLTDSQSVGDTITYNHEGTDVQATIVKEADVKHMMSKVSDTTDAKNVYGVFNCYDEEQSEEGYNDFLVASVGSFLVRIKANETIAKGDLLQSNGDGTAKVQSDDNIKSSSFAKVLSTTIIETYEDGSYIVPCSLMC